MYRLVFSLLFFGLCQSHLLAQGPLQRFEYWFDTDVSYKQQITINPGWNFDLNTDLNVEQLTLGQHAIYYRMQDSSGLWSPVQSASFVKQASQALATGNLGKAIYWFDANFGSKTTIPLSSGMSFDWNSSILAEWLSPGSHTLYILFENGQGLRSPVMAHSFLKMESATNGFQELSELQYWFDNNYIAAQSISTSSTLNFDSLLSLSQGLSEGLHVLRYRCIAGSGIKSVVNSSTFVKMPQALNASGSLSRLEFWNDNNYPQKSIIPVPGLSSSFNLDSGLAHEVQSRGLHTLYARFVDDRGLASPVLSQQVVKHGTPSTNPVNTINLISLHLQGDTTSLLLQPPFSPGVDIDLSSQSDLSARPTGYYYLDCLIRDGIGLLGQMLSDTFFKVAIPDAQIQASQTVLCDSGTVNFSSTVFDADSLYWNFGNGMYSHLPGASIHFASPGIYPVSLIAVDRFSMNADTAIIQIMVDQSPVVNLVSDTAICLGDSLMLDATNVQATYSWSNGAVTPVIVLSTGGSYRVTVTNANLCQTVDSMQLQILPLPILNLGPNLVLCDGDSAVLDAGAGMLNYHWSTGSNQRYLTIGTSGVFWVEVRDTNTCRSIDSVSLVLKPLPIVDLGPDTLLSSTNSLLLDATFPGASYLWNTSATTPTLLVTVAGKYWVRLDLSGCLASDTINIAINYGEEESLDAGFRIYPTPADEELLIEWNSQLQPQQWSLFNALGQLVMAGEFHQTGGQFERLSIGNLPEGFYLMRITTRSNVFSRRVVLAR